MGNHYSCNYCGQRYDDCQCLPGMRDAEMTKCHHDKLVQPDGVDEDGHRLPSYLQSTLEHLDTGRMKCSMCHEVVYYTGSWKAFYENGTPCACSTFVDRSKQFEYLRGMRVDVATRAVAKVSDGFQLLMKKFDVSKKLKDIHLKEPSLADDILRHFALLKANGFYIGGFNAGEAVAKTGVGTSFGATIGIYKNDLKETEEVHFDRAELAKMADEYLKQIMIKTENGTNLEALTKTKGLRPLDLEPSVSWVGANASFDPPRAARGENEWQDAVLDALASSGLELPMDTPPRKMIDEIVKFCVDVAMKLGGSGVNEPIAKVESATLNEDDLVVKARCEAQEAFVTGGTIQCEEISFGGILDGKPDYPFPFLPNYPKLNDDAHIEWFAQVMKGKMAAARDKGRGGWEEIDANVLSDALREHVEKGDPVDVANYCMMIAAKGMLISKPPQPKEFGLSNTQILRVMTQTPKANIGPELAHWISMGRAVINAFLMQSGQWVTNDATRRAALAGAWEEGANASSWPFPYNENKRKNPYKD